MLEILRVYFHSRKACWRFVEASRVRLDCSKVCWKLVEVCRVRFNYHKPWLVLGESVLAEEKLDGSM